MKQDFWMKSNVKRLKYFQSVAKGSKVSGAARLSYYQVCVCNRANKEGFRSIRVCVQVKVRELARLQAVAVAMVTGKKILLA